MSQIRMQAERLPRASSRRGGTPTGRASAARTAPAGSASTGIARFSMTVATQPRGGVTGSVPRP